MSMPLTCPRPRSLKDGELADVTADLFFVALSLQAPEDSSQTSYQSVLIDKDSTILSFSRKPHET